MSEQYADYEAAHSSAALFDRSPAGKIEVRGPEAPDFLHNLCTNDIKRMPLGAGCEAFFCNVRARALFLTRIYRVRPDGRDALWIDAAPGRTQLLLQHLDRHLIAEQAELADRSNEFAQFHLAGPSAGNVLATALGESIPPLELYQHMERTFGQSAVAHVRRYDPLGIPGYDIVCLNARSSEVRDLLIGAGAQLGSDIAWEWLRIEAGTPVDGVDFDDNRFVVEIGRADAISYTKGCYLGQEPIVMARDRAGFVNRTFRGLRLAQNDGIAKGSKLTAGDKEVGEITSIAVTPRLGAIALGYVRRGHEAIGTTLNIGDTSAIVTALPMRS